MRSQWMSNVDCECPKRGQKYLRISVCLFWFVFVVISFVFIVACGSFIFWPKLEYFRLFARDGNCALCLLGRGGSCALFEMRALVFTSYRFFFIDTCPTKQSICTKTHRWHFLCFLQVVVVKLAGSQHLRLKCLNLNMNVTCCVAIKRSRI